MSECPGDNKAEVVARTSRERMSTFVVELKAKYSSTKAYIRAKLETMQVMTIRTHRYLAEDESEGCVY